MSLIPRYSSMKQPRDTTAPSSRQVLDTKRWRDRTGSTSAPMGKQRANTDHEVGTALTIINLSNHSQPTAGNVAHPEGESTWILQCYATGALCPKPQRTAS